MELKLKKNFEKIEKDIKENINVKKRILKENLSQIVNASEICINSLNNGGKLIFCGNGGSASDAHHLATELLVRLRPNVNRKPIPAISLNLDTTSLTACGNDYSYEVYLSRMLEALGNKDDLLIVISTSGNSKNILKVLKKAKSMKIKSIAFLGKKGGAAKNYCENNIIINSNNTARIQEAHICIGHILMEIIENRIINEKVDVSIILSTKNFRNIENINQNFQNSQLDYEIIAVGPSKKNYEIDKLKIVQSFTKPVQCLEIAKNISKGEWLLIWSDDAFFLDIKKDNLKNLIDLAKNNENFLISCRLMNEINRDLNSHRYDTSNLNSPILPIAAPLKNEWIKSNGFYDKNFIATLADIDLYLRLMSKGFKVKIGDIKIIEKHKSNYSLNSDYHSKDRKVLNKFLAQKY